jgi:hypothetical protein
MNTNTPPPDQAADLGTLETDPWPARQLLVREREYRVYTKLLDKLERAIDLLPADPGDSLSPSDIGRLLELAGKFGRLSTGLPSDHTQHTLHDNRALRIQVSAAIKRIYSEPLDALAKRMHQLSPINAITETPECQRTENETLG